MSGTVVCSKVDCNNKIEYMCQVCKLSFCNEHAQKTQYKTNKGRLQFATLCLDDLEKGFNDELVTDKGMSRLMIQLGGLAIIILVIILIISLITS